MRNAHDDVTLKSTLKPTNPMRTILSWMPTPEYNYSCSEIVRVAYTNIWRRFNFPRYCSNASAKICCCSRKELLLKKRYFFLDSFTMCTDLIQLILVSKENPHDDVGFKSIDKPTNAIRIVVSWTSTPEYNYSCSVTVRVAYMNNWRRFEFPSFNARQHAVILIKGLLHVLHGQREMPLVAHASKITMSTSRTFEIHSQLPIVPQNGGGKPKINS